MQGTVTSPKSRRLKWVLIILFVMTVGSVLFLRNWPPFGGTVSGERLKMAQASSHYHDGEFANTPPHPPLESGDAWGYFIEQFFGDQTRVPPSAIPTSTVPLTSIQAELLRDYERFGLAIRVSIWNWMAFVYWSIQCSQTMPHPFKALVRNALILHPLLLQIFQELMW